MLDKKEFITRNISLRGDDVKAKRAEIKGYFLKTYTLFEELFTIFTDDKVFYEQPEKLRHPLIFYFGHTATFYINKLILSGFLQERINPHFESVFAIGVDEMSWDDLNQSNYFWPKVEDVRNYRLRVKEVVLDFIEKVSFSLPITWESPMWIVMMGIEHERIHLETSSVLHRQLEIKFIKQNLFFNESQNYGKTLENELLKVSGGKITLGKSKDDDFYGWDNEYGEATFVVDDFKASKYLTSNGEFLEFIEDGGYQNDSFWDDEGLRWRNYIKVLHPTFWILKKDSYYFRTLQTIIPLPLNWPVEVNYLEALAFCKWKSSKIGKKITLPSEAMWYRLHEVSGLLDEPQWGELAPANINLEHYCSPCPVNEFKHGDFYDVIGNVWQWTITTIDGFTGFEIHPVYDDFSVPTFNRRHNIIKGGSFISTGNEALLSSRYAFRRHFFQHAGFRYVEVSSDHKEDIEVVKEEITFREVEFFDRVAHIAKKYIKDDFKSALNLGCDYGKSLFELASYFENIIGIDFTARNILIAQKNLELQHHKNIAFWQGDSCNLKSHFSGYDFILLTNNFEEIYNIKHLLEDLPKRLNSGGRVVVAFKNFVQKEQFKESLVFSLKLIDETEFFTIWEK